MSKRKNRIHDEVLETWLAKGAQFVTMITNDPIDRTGFIQIESEILVTYSRSVLTKDGRYATLVARDWGNAAKAGRKLK